MAANSSVVLTQLDFDSHRASLKAFLKQQAEFKDYNFDGSSMGVLLDILSYNTYLNNFYLNMVGNEMFLDSAVLRDSVVSHAKELNYVPRSFTSATANLNLTVVSSDPAKRSIVVPKGTSFITRVNDRSFSFITKENLVATSSNSTFSMSDVQVYEGSYVSETYVINYSNPLVYKINNLNADISSVVVTVIEDNGANSYQYNRATSLFGYGAASKIFFVQPAIGDLYEIVFGDGVVGRKPKDNSVIIIEYRVCNGELPNGANKFTNASRIDGEANVTVVTSAAASGGAVAETLDSIKYNAPRAFTAQERAVTSEDYENILKANYPEINAVVAYGGETTNPPQYGRIFLSIDLNDIDGLPRSKMDEYSKFLRTRSSVSLEPIFVSPDYVYLRVTSRIKYNINTTIKNPEDIRTIVISSILDYASTNLNNFNRTLRYSRLIKSIDDSDAAIISNETDVEYIKYFTPTLNVPQNIVCDFKAPLIPTVPELGDLHPIIDIHAVSSTPFTYAGTPNCVLEDNGEGVVRVVVPAGNNHQVVEVVGTVDYDTGVVQLKNFKISNYVGTSLKIYGVPKTKDLSSSQNVILNILEPDVQITIDQVRE